MNNQNKNIDMSRKFLALSEALEIVNKELFNKTKMKKVAGFSLTEDKQKSLLAEKQALKNLIDQSNFDDNLKSLLSTQITDLNIPTALPVSISSSPILPTSTETMEVPKENPVENIKEEKKQEDVLLDEFEQKQTDIIESLNEVYENDNRINQLIDYIKETPLTLQSFTDLSIISNQLEDDFDRLTNPTSIEKLTLVLNEISIKMDILDEALSGREAKIEEVSTPSQTSQEKVKELEQRLEKLQEEKPSTQKTSKGDLEQELTALYGQSSYYKTLNKIDLNHLQKALPNIREPERKSYIARIANERKQARDENRAAVFPALTGEGHSKSRKGKGHKGQKLKKMNNRNDYKLDKKKSHLYIGSMIAGNDNKKVKRKLKK